MDLHDLAPRFRFWRKLLARRDAQLRGQRQLPGLTARTGDLELERLDRLLRFEPTALEWDLLLPEDPGRSSGLVH